MFSSTIYLSLTIAFLLVTLVLLIIVLQNSVDRAHVIATPTIRQQDGVLTSFASIKVRGSADEVFSVVKSFKSYSGYHWDDVDVDGVPKLGSSGIYRLVIDDFPESDIRVNLSFLDIKNRKLAEKSTTYPRWVLSSERVQEVVPIEGKSGICEYRTYQTLEGLGAYYILATAKEDMQENQRRHATDLKAFVEQEKT